jgi:glutaminyl-peptide cyclotransferase
MTCFSPRIQAAAFAFVALLQAAPALASECSTPKALEFTIESKITRSIPGYTQGLEFHDGKLYESTGRTGGGTKLNVIDLDGTVTTLADLGAAVFGEGLTILGGEVFQLTWKENLVLVYDLGGKQLRRMTNPRLGWGLANDGKDLVFTDGEGALHRADPDTFTLTGEVPLRIAEGEPPTWMNELEYVDGKLYGNVYMSDWIVRVDPASGCVEAVADMTLLREGMAPEELAEIAVDPGNVLNGIARDDGSGLFYITGKRWPMIYVGRFREAK